MRRFWIFVGFAVFFQISLLRAEQLAIGVSSNTIMIGSDFKGYELTLFGAIERDAESVSRTAGYDVVVALRGGRENISVRKAENHFGLWIQGETRVFRNVPKILSYVSTRNLDNIADLHILRGQKVGLQSLFYLGSKRYVRTGEVPQLDDFTLALLRLKEQRNQYLEQPGEVSFISKNLFSATLKLPENIPPGEYEIQTLLFNGGLAVAEATAPIVIQKTFFEQIIYDGAKMNPLTYGLMTLALACFMAVALYYLFRKD